MMSKVCENHVEIFQDDNVTKGFLQRVLISVVQDKPKVASQCCTSIEKLCSSLEGVFQD